MMLMMLKTPMMTIQLIEMMTIIRMIGLMWTKAIATSTGVLEVRR